MDKRYKKTVLFCVIIGVVVGIMFSNYKIIILYVKTFVNNTKNWGNDFSLIEIPSSYDGKLQKAFFYATKQINQMPLIVSLHSWSLDYRENDPLSDLFKGEDWNYIHPDFRGANNSPEAMMSDAVIYDIDDAIKYAIEKGNVDRDNIVIVGASGGGMATLGAYLRSAYTLKLCMAWCPISDLEAWYYQSRFADTKYWQDIGISTSSSDDIFNSTEAQKRSPLFIPDRVSAKNLGLLEIYAGINDGYTGTVSVLHSILFYNKMMYVFDTNDNTISDEDIIMLLSRSIKDDSNEYIGGRRIIYRKSHSNIRFFVFDGTHEILTDYAFSRIKKICLENKRKD